MLLKKNGGNREIIKLYFGDVVKWYTRLTQDQVPQGVWVRVPPSPQKKFFDLSLSSSWSGQQTFNLQTWVRCPSGMHLYGGLGFKLILSGFNFLSIGTASFENKVLTPLVCHIWAHSSIWQSTILIRWGFSVQVWVGLQKKKITVCRKGSRGCG